MPKVQKTPYSRVFLIRNRAGPANSPLYMGMSRATAFSWPQGDVTPVRAPSDSAYDEFDVIDEIRGEKGLPQLGLQAYYQQDLSELLDIVRQGCRLDLQVHMGACRDPRNFNGGWHKVLILEGARPTDYSTSELGAMTQGEEAVVNETVPFSGLDAYEIKRILAAEFGTTQVVQEVVDVTLCDSKTCGDCGIPSDGCQKFFAITKSHGGSPGLPAEVLYSSDGGTTLGETNVTTLGANMDPTALSCVGVYLVVVSNEEDAIHYALLADILEGTETWTKVTTGIVAAGSPNAIFSLGTAYTWMVGDGGYIYFTDDIASGFDVQNAGVATAQILYAIHGVDELNLVAVGAANAVVFTANGGVTWTSVTGPEVAVKLNTVWMLSDTEWLVGTDTGKLWYTQDSGTNWTQKAFPGSGAGKVYDIFFSTPSVGYMAHATAVPAGRILRTIDGGFSWYALPEDAVAFPTNDAVKAVVGCEDDPNVVFGGGLAGDGTDGFLVKVA